MLLFMSIFVIGNILPMTNSSGMHVIFKTE